MERGWLKVKVRVVGFGIDHVTSVRGVLLSVSGGKPHVPHPPSGTVRACIVSEKPIIRFPSLREDIAAKSSTVIGIRVVLDM